MNSSETPTDQVHRLLSGPAIYRTKCVLYVMRSGIVAPCNYRIGACHYDDDDESRQKFG